MERTMSIFSSLLPLQGCQGRISRRQLDVRCSDTLFFLFEDDEESLLHFNQLRVCCTKHYLVIDGIQLAFFCSLCTFLQCFVCGMTIAACHDSLTCIRYRKSARQWSRKKIPVGGLTGITQVVRQACRIRDFAKIGYWRGSHSFFSGRFLGACVPDNPSILCEQSAMIG